MAADRESKSEGTKPESGDSNDDKKEDKKEDKH